MLLNPAKFSSSKASLKQQAILFIVIFVVISTIVGAIFFSWYFGQSKQEFDYYRVQEEHSLKIYQQNISKEYDSVIADLNILASLPQLTNNMNNDKKLRQELIQIYTIFAAMRQRYHQIRYLDNDGNEMVRINYENGKVQVVPENQLQGKKHRYYVEDIKQLKPGEIYVSPFDLNIEHNVIEAPYRPMIRLGKRFFDEQNQPQGMIIINYEGKFLLKALEHGHSIMHEDTKLMLLNKDGYWFKASDPQLEWGFMFARKKDLTYKVLYPDVWQAIRKSTFGQYENSNGLYTFLKIDPLRPSTLMNSTLISDRPLITRKGHENTTWILISHLPRENYHHQTDQTVQQNMPYMLLLILSSVIVSLILARYQSERRRLISRNKYLASHDALTGLYNRSVLDQELPLKLVNAGKIKQSCCIYYLDLDNFKPINDTYGHDIGDEVLQVVAHRLQGVIRKNRDLVIRLGGDEIMVIVCGLDSEQERIKFGSKLIGLFKSPMHVEHHTLKLGATIGCASYPHDSDNLDQLVSMADTALYHAKNQQKGSLKLYSELQKEEREIVTKT